MNKKIFIETLRKVPPFNFRNRRLPPQKNKFPSIENSTNPIGLPGLLITLLGVLVFCPSLRAGDNAASFNPRPLEPWKESSIVDMYYFVPTRAGTDLPHLFFTSSCRSFRGCEAVIQYKGNNEANLAAFDWSVFHEKAGHPYAKTVNLPSHIPQYLTQRPDQLGVVRQMIRIRNGSYYLGPADGKFKFRNQIDLFDFERGDWDVFYSREYYAETEEEGASWRGKSSSLAWMAMVETFGNYANKMTEVLGCDLVRMFYDGECLWQTPDNTFARLPRMRDNQPSSEGKWLLLSHVPHTHFAVCVDTSSHQPTVAPPSGVLCVTANTKMGGFTLNTESGVIDPFWVETPYGQWWDKTVTQLPPGHYRISFDSVPGQSTPPEQIFQISANNVTTVTAIYGADAENLPVALLTSPREQQTLWGDSLSATTLVAAGTPPYTVKFFARPAGREFTQIRVADAEPYTVSLGAPPIGAYQIYATVEDSSTPVAKTGTSAIHTFFVSPSVTWSSTDATGNWSDPQGWDSGAVPVSGATPIFGSGGDTCVVDSMSRTVSSIIFNRTEDFTLSASGDAGLTIQNGMITRNNFTHAISAPITLGRANIWNVNEGGTLQVSGAVSGDASLTKAGSGTLELSGNNSFTGGVILEAGTLQLGSGSNADSALGTGTLNIHAGASIIGPEPGKAVTLSNNNPIGIHGDFKAGDIDFGTGPVMIAEPISVMIGNRVTFGGAISGPDGLNALDIIFRNMINSTYSVQLQAPITLRGNQTVTGSGSNFNGVIGDNGQGYGLNVAVSDMWGEWGGKLALNADNTYRGDTMVSSGLLLINHDRALQNSALHSAPDIASLSVTTPTFGGLKGDTDLASVFTAGYDAVTALRLNPQSGTCTYSGAIADGANGMTLTKSGKGTQVLGGSITSTGAVNIVAGTLILNGSHRGGGTVIVRSGARFGGNGSTSSAVTVQSAAKLLVGISDWDAGKCSHLTVGTLNLPATWSVDVTAEVAGKASKSFPFLTVTGGINRFTAPRVNGPGEGTWQVRQDPSNARVLNLVYTAAQPPSSRPRSGR